jgi:hypothetical protein
MELSKNDFYSLALIMEGRQKRFLLADPHNGEEEKWFLLPGPYSRVEAI